MTIIRVGEGRSTSGKILDRETHWYNINEKEHAIADSIKRNRSLYVSINNKKYIKVSINELNNERFYN